MTVTVSVVIDAPPSQVWAVIEPIETHVEWMADAESITFTSAQHRGVGTTFDCLTQHRSVPHERPHDRDRMGAGSGDGHRAPRPLHRHRPLHPRTGGSGADALHAGRRRSTSRGGWPGRSAQRGAQPILQRVWRANLERLAAPRSIPRMTNLAVSVAGLQTLGAPMSLDVAREADELGYTSVWVAEANAAEAMSLLGAISQVAPHAGLGTGVLALATSYAAAARDGRRDTAATRGRSRRVPRRRYLVAGGRGPMARRGLRRSPPSPRCASSSRSSASACPARR